MDYVTLIDVYAAKVRRFQGRGDAYAERGLADFAAGAYRKAERAAGTLSDLRLLYGMSQAGREAKT